MILRDGKTVASIHVHRRTEKYRFKPRERLIRFHIENLDKNYDKSDLIFTNK